MTKISHEQARVPSETRRAYRCCFAIALTLSAVGCVAPNETTGERSELEPRRAMTKQVAALSTRVAGEPARLVVKFNEGTGVRVAGGLLSATSTGALPASSGVRSRAQLDAELSAAQGTLAARGLQLRRLFAQGEGRLGELKQRGERRSRRALADLRLYFQIPAEHFASLEEMEQARDALNALNSVELAYIEARSEPAQLEAPDANTPAFSALQGYGDPAPVGIDAAYAATFAGGRGAGVSVIDVEQGWNLDHEDFPPMVYALGDPSGGEIDHGTAVVGVIAALDNGFGITGLTPDVDMGYSSVFTTDNGGQSAGAILNAVDVLEAGDIILIEQHRPGPQTTTCTCNSSQCNYLPLEFMQADFDAIATATANGIIVVEAAGNGSVDFEDPAYGGLLSRNTRDSGAILVGASESGRRSPMCWSNHGPRVDVHGWGENVATLGYGDLYSGALGEDDLYTRFFSGTSSASPIVTSAAAALQGVSLESRGTPLTPTEVRGLLRAHGTAQTDDLGRPIGALPDLRSAIDALNAGDSVLRAAFTVDCDDQGVCSYEDASYELFGNVVARRWSFDDGMTSTERNPVHAYSSFGDHAVTLTVTDDDGDTATTTGVTTLAATTCSERETVLFEGFESGFGSFTSSGSVSRTTSAAHSGSYGARVRGTGQLQTVLDVSEWQNLSFSGWARAIGYDAGEVLFFELCPLVNGQCDEARRVYHESPVGSAGLDDYTFYQLDVFGDLSGVTEVSVSIGARASSSFEYAYFDEILFEGRRCEPIDCLSDAFCDNALYCDGAESCVEGACRAGTPPCASGSCNEAGQSCDGTGGACGDGSLDDGEECDDGNTANGDGCSSSCTVEVSDCLSASATLAQHVNAGRAYPQSAQNCSACWLGCSWPSGCATTVTTYYAIGTGEVLGTQGSAQVVLYSGDDGASWSTTACDEPACESDAECDDADACTIDRCEPSGCVSELDPQCPMCIPNGGSCTYDSECCSGDCYGWRTRTCRP